jgi:hypothetical protein
MAKTPTKKTPTEKTAAPQPAASDTKPDTSGRARVLAMGQKKED